MFLIIEQPSPPIHLVFLGLDTDQPHLDFKILDENNNEVIPKTFYLQLLNKQWVYTTLFNKNEGTDL